MVDNNIDVDSFLINKNCQLLSVEDINCDVYYEKSFSIIDINIRSLSANFEKLLNFLSNFDFKFHIIVLNEIKLDDRFNRIFGISDYYHKSLYRNRNGGGIRIYYLPYVSLNINNELSSVFSHSEILVASVKCKDFDDFNLCCIYRPPDSDKYAFLDHLNQNILANTTIASNMVIIGDLNLDFSKRFTGFNFQFYNSLFNSQLRTMITLPTYVKPNESNASSILDQIATNTKLNCRAFVIDNIIADHLPICLCVKKLKSNELIDIKFRDFSQNNINRFFENYNEIFYEMLVNYLNCSVDIAHQQFEKFCTNTANKFFPICRKKIGKSKINSPWVSKNARKCLKVQSELRKLLRKGYAVAEFYKLYSAFLNKLLRIARENYYSYTFENNKNNHSVIWKKVNELYDSCKNKSQLNQIKVDGVVCNDQLKIANHFNNYFVSITSSIKQNMRESVIEYTSLIENNMNTIYLFPSTSEEVFEIVKSLKNSNSVLDIPTKMFKLFPQFSEGLSCLFNFIISQGTYPSTLKIASVIPIHKRGSWLDVANFRPISILPVVDKIFERLILKRLLPFLTINKIISKDQHAYLKGRSTFSALENLISKIIPAFQDNEYAFVLFADLRLGFDCVDVNILLEKLYKYGIRGIAYNLISSFLINRKQKVFINGIFSNLLDLSYGVPQGSTLGPLFFNLYINDLPNALKRICDFSTILYADDTTIVYKCKNLDQGYEKLSVCLNSLNDWLCYNKLALNPVKTKYMIFTNKPVIEMTLSVNNHIIEREKFLKYLGVILDSKLTYCDHIKSVEVKLSMFYAITGRISYNFNLNTAIIFYYSYIYSVISYAIFIWGFRLTQPSSSKLIEMHMKIVCNLFWRHSTPYCCNEYILKKHKIFKLDDIYRFNLYCMMHKVINDTNSQNSYLHNQLQLCYKSKQTSYETRTTNNIYFPFCRVDAVKNNFINIAITQWNLLPFSLRKLSNIAEFKRKVKDNIFSNYCNH